MKIIFCILFFAITTFAQVSLLEGPKVNGIALSATYKQVLAKFGKPSSDKINKVDECIGDRTRTVKYPGLMFEMDEQKGTFHVYSFEVTSPMYDVSGVKVGNAPAAVQQRFGTRKRTVENPGPRWFYDMTDENPGGTNFYFREGKLVKIQTSYMMC